MAKLPLWSQLKRGPISLVALLIHSGADVNVVDNNGMNPLALTAVQLATSAKVIMTESWHAEGDRSLENLEQFHHV